eukprot:g6782.t1
MARAPDEDEELVEVSLLDHDGTLLDWVAARPLESTTATRKKRVFVLPTPEAAAHGYPQGVELTVDPRRIREKMPYAENELDLDGGEDDVQRNVKAKKVKAGKGGRAAVGAAAVGAGKYLLPSDELLLAQETGVAGVEHQQHKVRAAPAPSSPFHNSSVSSHGDEAAAATDPFGEAANRIRESVAQQLDDATHIKPARRMAKELRQNIDALRGDTAGPGGDKIKNQVIAFLPNPAKLFEWRVALRAPEHTPYAKATFYLHCNFCNRTSGESKYPFEPPKLQFATPIFHPNVSQRGKICLNTLNDKAEWSPMMDVSMLCVAVSVLMQQPNCQDPLNTHASGLLQKHPVEFKRKAREWTRKYAYLEADFDKYNPGGGGAGAGSGFGAGEEDSSGAGGVSGGEATFAGAGSSQRAQLRKNPNYAGQGPSGGEVSLIERERSPRTAAVNPLMMGANNAASNKPAESGGRAKEPARPTHPALRQDGDDASSSLAAIVAKGQKANNRGKMSATGFASENSSMAAAGLLHTDPFAEYQTDGRGRALDDQEASRRIRWEQALQVYRTKKAAGLAA